MSIPKHLKKYIVDQNYKKYTPEDQAVWRYIMKGIENTMHLYGHKKCISGMKKTGIAFDQIPKISNINKKLKQWGWRAMPISGFIPPKDFMEFQLNKILPIASELRSIKHISYTPAPDIVHESVGHVPFLTDSKFTNFLTQYADTVLKSLSSMEDENQYIAIRELSDLKENSKSTPKQILKAEKKLKTITKNMSHTSESSYLSRFIWWTSEYGLIGDLKNPKIYGAGLISSIEEAKQVHKVKKIWLDKNCLNYSYDITRFQPQLFVIEDFSHLLEVLNEITQDLSWKRGGVYGVNQSIKSQTINTVVLDSGLQISGVTQEMIHSKNRINFLKFSGPCQISFKDQELRGHNKSYHNHGYSTPLRLISKNKKPFHLWKDLDLKRAGLKEGKTVKLKFESHIQLQGTITKFLRKDSHLLMITFKNCRVTRKEQLLFDPSWGLFDLAIGQQVVSVFSGSADAKAYKNIDNFKPSQIPKKILSKQQKSGSKLYKKINKLSLQKKSPAKKTKVLRRLLSELLKHKNSWLEALELLELSKENLVIKKEILRYLNRIKDLKMKKYIRDGIMFYK